MAITVKSDAYKAAGVDIDLAQKLLGGLKSKLAKARRPEMLAPIGGFGGLFSIDLSKWREPVMVSSIDGVGTKLEVAMRAGRFAGVGHDIVNHCVNDIAVQGLLVFVFLGQEGVGLVKILIDLAEVVGLPELELSGSLEELTHTVRILDAGEFDQDAAAALQLLDVGLCHTETVDTGPQDLIRTVDGAIAFLLQNLQHVAVGGVDGNAFIFELKKENRG